MCKKSFSNQVVLTVLFLIIAVIIAPQQAQATPTVGCNSPFVVVAGTGGQHAVTAVAGSGDIANFGFGSIMLPSGIRFEDIAPSLPDTPVSATVTVDSTVPAGTYLVDIIAEDQD